MASNYMTAPSWDHWYSLCETPVNLIGGGKAMWVEPICCNLIVLSALCQDGRTWDPGPERNT